MATTAEIAALIRQMQAAQNQANAANESRYQQGLTTLQGGQTAAQQGYQQAAQQLQAQQQAAQGLLTNYQSQAGSALDAMRQAYGQIGQTARREAQEGLKQQTASGTQSLISSGLADSTILQNMQRAAQSDYQKNLQSIGEQEAARAASLAQQQLGVAGTSAGLGQYGVGLMSQSADLSRQLGLTQMQGAGDIASYIAQRNDITQDPAMMASLIQSAAANQPMTGSSGWTLGPMASSGRDIFGQPLGGSGGGSSSGGGSISSAMGSGSGGGTGTTTTGSGGTQGPIGGGFNATPYNEWFIPSTGAPTATGGPGTITGTITSGSGQTSDLEAEASTMKKASSLFSKLVGMGYATGLGHRTGESAAEWLARLEAQQAALSVARR